MKKRFIIWLTVWSIAFLVIGATVVTKISQYPNVVTPDDNDLLLLASGATNKNVKWSDARTAIRGGSAQSANLVMATPDGTAGIASLRSMVAADVPSLAASKITSGTMATARLGSGTADTTTFLGGDQTYKQVADAQVANAANIAKSKISTSSTWADADIPSTISRVTGTETLQNKTITSTADGGNNTLKFKNSYQLIAPHNCDGAGAIIYTNDNTKPYFGQAAFSGSAATNANFVEYRLTVPNDLDTAVDLKVESWTIRLGAGDTSAHKYNIGMASVAASASYDAPTIGQWVAIDIGADASGASADVEMVTNVTLTGWRSNMTANQVWVIRINRDGAGDSSTQISYSGPLVISYGSSQ